MKNKVCRKFNSLKNSCFLKISLSFENKVEINFIKQLQYNLI
jgi:hypothetical protein